MAFHDVEAFRAFRKTKWLRWQLNQSRKRLANLQALREWQAELSGRLRRAELLFEHVAADVGCETLADEVAAFAQVVARLFAEGGE
jgi:hypothetical protein